MAKYFPGLYVISPAVSIDGVGFQVVGLDLNDIVCARLLALRDRLAEVRPLVQAGGGYMLHAFQVSCQHLDPELSLYVRYVGPSETKWAKLCRMCIGTAGFERRGNTPAQVMSDWRRVKHNQRQTFFGEFALSHGSPRQLPLIEVTNTGLHLAFTSAEAGVVYTPALEWEMFEQIAGIPSAGPPPAPPQPRTVILGGE